MPTLTTKPITDKKTWENFILSKPEANFLQSYNYGTFLESLNNKIFRLGIYQNQKLIGIALVNKETARRGTYLSIAGGPILNFSNQQVLKLFTKYIYTLAKKEKAIFVRIRPQEIGTHALKKSLQNHNWQPSPINLEAEHTLLLDLTQSNEELLKNMRKNTRYEIKKSFKLNIKTRISQDPNDVKQFCEYQQMLGKKHGFKPFSFQFLYKQFLSLTEDDQVALIHAYKDKKLLASAYIIFYNHKAAYHYGITTPYNTRLPGAYACQWAVIQEAKKRSIKEYNLWGGLIKEGTTNHRYKGVDLFKRGFGGKEVQFLPSHDLPVNWLYKPIKLFELLRKKYRRL